MKYGHLTPGIHYWWYSVFYMQWFKTIFISCRYPSANYLPLNVDI